ncbi:DoxX family protein [Candidatus Marinamargulisbacteria bacterium SCGC AG-439-L15]|nr:DoxX family protein [Candidatus Marinamargulisbacteria bacterium SCGC AG-439-L15]
MNTRQMGLFFFRLSLGLTMLLAHGLPKLERYGKISTVFPDPFGVGSAVSLTLVIFAELFCSLFLILGIWTRVALIPLIITMATAFFIVHMDDPFNKKELALLYLMSYITLFLTGGGAYSLLKPKGLPKTPFFQFIAEEKP